MKLSTRHASLWIVHYFLMNLITYQGRTCWHLLIFPCSSDSQFSVNMIMSYVAYSLWRNELTMCSHCVRHFTSIIPVILQITCEICINILTVQISKAGIFSKTSILLWVNHIGLLFFFLQVRKGKKEFKKKK